jgi:hypothetical protein
MAQTKMSNELYLTVLPIISLSPNSYGKTEQILTLMGDKNLATEFFPDEVNNYVLIFKNRTKYLEGGHVTGYDFSLEEMESGRVIVRVTQNVK